jgi:heme-degrading monooxygenase HmoA
MKKTVLFAFMLLGISSFCFVNKPKASVDQPITEMVVYEVKPEVADQVDLIVQSVNREMQSFPGFLSRKVYRSEKIKNRFTDFVTWRSKEDAEAAYQKVHTSAACSRFLSSINKVIVFEYLDVVN